LKIPKATGWHSTQRTNYFLLAKNKTTFYCQNCGTSSPKWQGKCPACGEWNTYVEEVITSSHDDERLWSASDAPTRRSKPISIGEVVGEKIERTSSGDNELDRVLGGGIVAGSLVLIGGEPGIGKSTLMLQVALRLIDHKVLYISGEESVQQIKMRAERMGMHSSKCFLLSETNLQEVFSQIPSVKPDVVVIDSIQTLHSSNIEATPGSISQVRECTGQLMRYAKESNVPVFLIGHINKEGNIAGPKVLEHMVDTVLQFEGDRHHLYRILRTSKNRFGSTSELGIYQMMQEGLREVKNPSEILLSGDHDAPGVAIGASIEGNRPLMIEIQALVSPATYGTPQRSTTGFDIKRLHMLLAVLEKRMGLKLGTQDVFLNVTGGIRVDDPSLDLAVCAAVFSSYHEIMIDKKSCLIGEVGLGGEIRSVNRLENRLKEAQKLGFEKVFLAKDKEPLSIKGIRTYSHSSLRELLKRLFG
jgi:DNA repair protein RadA/Sms